MGKKAEELAKQLYPDPKLEDYDDILVYRADRDSAIMGRANVMFVYKQAKKDLGWISVKDRLPEERKYESDTLQGHHEWTESDRVFVLDDRGVAMVDSLRNGKFWLDGHKDCDGFPHYIEYWMPIPKLPNKK